MREIEITTKHSIKPLPLLIDDRIKKANAVFNSLARMMKNICGPRQSHNDAY